MNRQRLRLGVVLHGLVAVLVLLQFTHAEKCLQEDAPPQYTQYNGKQLNLTLATTNRLSQLIITHYLRIYLVEKLGYRDVQIVPIDDRFDTEYALGKTRKPYNVPEWMVNVEVWIPPEEDTGLLFEQYEVKECGTIGPPGRMGWFIPKSLVHWVQDSPKDLDVHWTTFKQQKSASYFDIEDVSMMKLIQNYTERDINSRFNCTLCEENGMFIPDQCKDYGPRKSPCALLLAGYYEHSEFIIEHIQQLKLYVKVVWLGKNQKKIFNMLLNRYQSLGEHKSLVILSWIPNEIVHPQNDFTSVSFPSYNILESQNISYGYKYELTRLSKIVWTKLRYAARSAYDYLHYFSVSSEDYDYLFNEIKKNNSLTPEQVACQWIKSTNPKPYGGKSKIVIGGIFPITGNASLSYTGTGIQEAATMAQIAINLNKNILPDYDLQLTTHDGMCKSENVMKSFIDMIHNNYLLGVLGPACSETVEPLVGVSKMFNIITISYSAEGVSFTDRTKYPYFFRTIGDNQHYNPVYLDLFKTFEWKRVAALTEDGQKYTEYISHMQDLLQTEDISFIDNKKFPREREPDAMKKYLEDLKRKRARIIIVDVADDVARCVMCQAYHLNMTSKHGYVWFLPMWLSNDWFNSTYYNIKNNESVPCNANMMIEAVNGYFALTHAFYAPDDAEISIEHKQVGKWREEYKNRCAARGTPTSDYGGYAYDAMWTYALALDKLLYEKPEAVSTLRTENTALNLVKYIKETNFDGVSGRIRFGNGPSRFSVINIVQWTNQTTHLVGSFEPNITDDRPEVFHGKLKLNKSAIVWLSGQIPTDGTEPPPVCVFETVSHALGVECEIAIIFVNVFGITSLAIILTVIALYVLKRKYERKVLAMQTLGIDLITTNMNLDKWEIPRDRVVINRKLGEGEFGTVYGGEAYFPEKGWMGVAVKTLKVGSTTEEKLDFLSEAEIMKRFDHKNIVKLVGVCTQNEPVYTVMEFMLYGDLKTFLLARRHLVNEKSFEEHDEISSKKLTSMALDVARALSYLAEMKFVHRDVACRNCLLNAQRMVKLGDFGMTRPMFENDYYKFNRKGMLPVRWMAPESLGLGVFTPSSDVWSYGVLLYEIITFGSFPFQGMSNFQVLEHVKEGNILTIPSGVKPQLEALIKSCWNLDHKRRPQAKQIVEFLANAPRLLSPCLDVPLSSVCLEDTTTEMDVGLPELFRKCSVDPNLKNLQTPDISTPLMSPFPFGRQQSISSAIISDTGSVLSNDIEAIPLEHSYVKEPLLGQICTPQYRTENDRNKCVPLRRQPSDSEYIPLDGGFRAEAISIL